LRPLERRSTSTVGSRWRSPRWQLNQGAAGGCCLLVGTHGGSVQGVRWRWHEEIVDGVGLRGEWLGGDLKVLASMMAHGRWRIRMAGE
jgi:hypothetical protein